MDKTITFTSPAAAGTVAVSDTFSGLGSFSNLQFYATLTGATGGDLDVYLQTKVGDHWYDYVHFPTVYDGDAVITWGASAQRSAIGFFGAEVGVDLVPALGEGWILNGDFGDSMRIVSVAGVGTSAGAAQSISVSGTWPIEMK